MCSRMFLASGRSSSGSFASRHPANGSCSAHLGIQRPVLLCLITLHAHHESHSGAFGKLAGATAVSNNTVTAASIDPNSVGAGLSVADIKCSGGSNITLQGGPALASFSAAWQGEGLSQCLVALI